jgi:adenine-specific DNA-methyltransferase
MKLKQVILAVMDRDTLKAVVDDLEIEEVDRRSIEAMRAKVSRSHRATPEVLLDYLNERQVKAVCEEMGIDPKGRRNALLERLLASIKEETRLKKTIQAGSVRAATRKKNRPKKESTPMSETKSTINAVEQGQAPVRLPDPLAGMMRVTRTELVWPGKYNEDGSLKEVPRVNLPFQVIETVNETRATREALTQKGGIQRSLFDIYEANEGDTFEDGWKNKLIWGDNLLVMGSLLEKFAGKIDLIYIDPPFATGADFSFVTQIGESGEQLTKEQSIIEEKAYRDTWGKGISSYLQMMVERLIIMHDLLSDKGSMYIHLDWHVGHYVKLLMDSTFGTDNFRNEIVWHYPGREMHITNKYNAKHDVLLFYGKTSSTQVRMAAIATPYDKEARLKGLRRKLHTDEEGREWVWETRGQAAGQKPYKRYLDDILAQGKPISDVWDDLQFLRGNHPERVDYATQKPSWLLERIVLASSDKNSIVADFFCGSGTTLAVAEKLGRRWIGCDLGRWAIHVTRKRLLGIESCKPFDVLNLGKYERQYWQGVTFGKSKDKFLTEQALYEYLSFILKLYGAQPVAGLIHLHGKKGRAMVHVGAVDAPVTISEIDAAVDECVQLKQPELHVLGWEWEMGLYDLMVEAAKKKGVKLLLLQIPREVMEQQAAAKGDVRFFELAYLEAEIKTPKKLTAQVSLKDFVIPNTELIPEEVRSKVKKWSDYIDYWAVDWDFQNDTFMQGWVAFRTRKERKLPLVSDPHTYEKSGRYRILVKVIDIFGNDTSQAFDVEGPLS